jgi:predicted nucleic acid-binding protein
MSNEFFLDTAYAIALSVESDEHHHRAEELAAQLLANQTPLITTRAVLLEIGNALSKERYRQAAVELLDALERDPQVEIVLITEELYQKHWPCFAAAWIKNGA